MNNRQNNTLVFGIVGLLVAIITIVIVYIAFLLLSTPQTVTTPDYLLDDDGITIIEPPLEMPSFTLHDDNNLPISLSDLDGQATLITFGFTHCPDVCPITLGEMLKIHDDLGELADTMNFIFVSVDGERDTPEVLRTYFRTLRVDDFVIGMTGTELELREFAQPFGVEFIHNERDQFGNYTVDHTAGMFLLDADQNWVRRYRYGIQSEAISDNIQAFLAQ